MLGVDITANYSTPAKPMQLAYNGDGIKCEYLLMTVGERGATSQKAKKARANTKGPAVPQLEAAASRANSHAQTPVPQAAPVNSEPRRNHIPSLRPTLERPSQRPPPATFESESLFVPQDNDEQWEPVNVGEEEEEEEEENVRLGWDASVNPVSSPPRSDVKVSSFPEITDNSLEFNRNKHTHHHGQPISFPAGCRDGFRLEPNSARADATAFSGSQIWYIR